MKVWTALLVCAMALTSQNVLAKRLAGGTSVGKQSTQVTQREGVAAPTAAPTQSTTVPAVANKPAAAANASVAPAQRPWAAMLGGLAAGLGLAWLASSLGWGEGLAQFLTLVLVLMSLTAAVVWFLRSRKASVTSSLSPLAFQSAGSSPIPRDYSPKNVGNDASARPWEQGSMPFDAASAEAEASTAWVSHGQKGWGIPAGFDTESFLKASKDNFVLLQAAWDRADVPALRAMMTDDMIGQIQQQLADREGHTGAALNLTEVVMLEAQLLGIEDMPNEYMASVEFSGMIREEPTAGPNPFREVWNITRPKTGQGGWLVAGVQALQ
jgi:predicted lipid-binding transport protein (Tim44 family)